MATYMIDGRLTNDAVMKAGKNGKEFMTFSIAWNMKNKQVHYYACTMNGSERTTKLLPYMRRGKYLIVVGEPYWTEYNGKTYEYIQVDKLSFVGDSSEQRQESAPSQSTGSGWGLTFPHTENGITFNNEDEYDRYQFSGEKPNHNPQQEQKDFDDFADIPF